MVSIKPSSAPKKTSTSNKGANWKRIAGTVAVGALAYGAYKGYKYITGGNNSNSNSDSGSSSSGGDSSGGDDGSSSGGDTGSTRTKTVVEEIPIDNYEDASKFAQTEWNKIRRDDGRTLECQVMGSTKWRTGEWCKVLLPSMNINDYMYITRVSQNSDGGDWTCNLTLVDFPPGWGKEVIETNDDMGTDENADAETDTEGTSEE